jgi:hypothetical protein
MTYRSIQLYALKGSNDIHAGSCIRTVSYAFSKKLAARAERDWRWPNSRKLHAACIDFDFRGNSNAGVSAPFSRGMTIWARSFFWKPCDRMLSPLVPLYCNIVCNIIVILRLSYILRITRQVLHFCICNLVFGKNLIELYCQKQSCTYKSMTDWEIWRTQVAHWWKLGVN